MSLNENKSRIQSLSNLRVFLSPRYPRASEREVLPASRPRYFNVATAGAAAEGLHALSRVHQHSSRGICSIHFPPSSGLLRMDPFSIL